MANHESPEWETATPSTERNSFWNRLSQPFTSGNPFLRTPRPTVERNTTYFNRSPTAQTQNFDKETAISERVGTGTAEDGIVARDQRRYCGRSKRSCSLILLATGIILILIIGLAAGLATRKASSAQNLPLPSNHDIFTGDLTYYSPGPGYGACGFENTSQDSICAVSHLVWDASLTGSNSNDNPLCGKKIRITRNDGTGNHSVDVEVVDRCVGCKATDLDLSLKMFDSLADESQGRVVGSWAWLN